MEINSYKVLVGKAHVMRVLNLEVFMVMKFWVAFSWVVTPCSDVKMEAAWPSEVFISYHITTWCHSPEDWNFNITLSS